MYTHVRIHQKTTKYRRREKNNLYACYVNILSTMLPCFRTGIFKIVYCLFPLFHCPLSAVASRFFCGYRYDVDVFCTLLFAETVRKLNTIPLVIVWHCTARPNGIQYRDVYAPRNNSVTVTCNVHETYTRVLRTIWRVPWELHRRRSALYWRLIGRSAQLIAS